MYILTHYTLLLDDKLHNQQAKASCCQILLLLPFVAGFNLCTTLSGNIRALFLQVVGDNSILKKAKTIVSVIVSMCC